MHISFFVEGTPRPAGSKRTFPVRRGGVLTGKTIVTDDSGPSGKKWRQAVKFEARRCIDPMLIGGALLAGAVRVDTVFLLARPQSHYSGGKGPRRLKPNAPAHHIIACDADKLRRSVLDAMTGVVYRDDAQAVRGWNEKRFCEGDEVPGVQIMVETIE